MEQSGFFPELELEQSWKKGHVESRTQRSEREKVPEEPVLVDGNGAGDAASSTESRTNKLKCIFKST